MLQEITEKGSPQNASTADSCASTTPSGSSNYLGRNPQQSDLEDDPRLSSRKRPSSTCLHCDFRSDSPTILTQHLWEVHPLRMRRKQHLFNQNSDGTLKSKTTTTDKRAKSNKLDVQPEICKGIEQGNKTYNIDSSTTTDISRRIPSTSSNFRCNQPPTSSSASFPTVRQPMEGQEAAVRQQLELYSQINASNQVLYPSNCGLLIPNHYVTIPYGTNSSLLRQLALPISQSQLYTHEAINNALVINAMNLQLQQSDLLLRNFNAQRNNEKSQQDEFQPGLRLNLQRSLPNESVQQTKSISSLKYTGDTSQENNLKSPNPDKVKTHAVTLTNADRVTSKSEGCKRNEVVKLLCSGPKPVFGSPSAFVKFTGSKKKDTKHCGVSDGSNRKSSSNEKLPRKPHFQVQHSNNSNTGSLIDNERMLELENALQSVCFYDVNETSSVMPFRCPDDVWRMVRFKCIKGVWLVQFPDSANPTLYVPLQKPAGKDEQSLREALKKSFSNNKKCNPLLRLFNTTDEKFIECPMIHPDSSTSKTKKPVDMFTNVEKSDVRAKHIQVNMKKTNTLRNLLISGTGLPYSYPNNKSYSNIRIQNISNITAFSAAVHS